MNIIINIIIFISIIIIWWSIIVLVRLQKRKIDMINYKMNIECSEHINIDSITTLLDDIVTESFDEYLIFNIGIINLPYINTEMEQKISNDMIDIVSQKLSPVLYDKLSLYYNKNIIPDMLSKKIFMFVTSYVINRNKPK